MFLMEKRFTIFKFVFSVFAVIAINIASTHRAYSNSDLGVGIYHMQSAQTAGTCIVTTVFANNEYNNIEMSLRGDVFAGDGSFVTQITIDQLRLQPRSISRRNVQYTRVPCNQLGSINYSADACAIDGNDRPVSICSELVAVFYGQDHPLPEYDRPQRPTEFFEELFAGRPTFLPTNATPIFETSRGDLYFDCSDLRNQEVINIARAGFKELNRRLSLSSEINGGCVIYIPNRNYPNPYSAVPVHHTRIYFSSQADNLEIIQSIPDCVSSNRPVPGCDLLIAYPFPGSRSGGASVNSSGSRSGGTSVNRFALAAYGDNQMCIDNAGNILDFREARQSSSYGFFQLQICNDF